MWAEDLDIRPKRHFPFHPYNTSLEKKRVGTTRHEKAGLHSAYFKFYQSGTLVLCVALMVTHVYVGSRYGLIWVLWCFCIVSAYF